MPSAEYREVDVAVVGGGISGLALAWRLRQIAPELRFVLLEGDSRTGGKLLSERVRTGEGEFLIEAGPDSLLTQKREGLELIEELGMSDQLIPIAQGMPTAILHRGKPETMPAGMRLIVPTDFGAFMRSPLVSLPGKLRARLDEVLPARKETSDESIASFVRRRFGSEMVERMAEPILAGIHNGDPERLSLRATFPQLEQLEQKHRSLIRGMKSMPASGGGAPFITLRDGMESLASELASRLKDVIRTDSAVDSIIQNKNRYLLRLKSGEVVSARQVVLTTSTAIASELSREIAPEISQSLAKFETNHAGSISLAVRTSAITKPLPGYGLVIPRAERRSINAITVASLKFAGRAPEGWTLLRLFFGGARSPHTMNLDDTALLNVVRQELRELLGVSEAPHFWRITRWPAGNPQYEVGHIERVEAIARALPGGLFLLGSAYRGVGISDLIRAANGVAGRIMN
ncbi:protoporphyrinogen oxidase [soil metagenome]